MESTSSLESEVEVPVCDDDIMVYIVLWLGHTPCKTLCSSNGIYTKQSKITKLN